MFTFTTQQMCMTWTEQLPNSIHEVNSITITEEHIDAVANDGDVVFGCEHHETIAEILAANVEYVDQQTGKLFYNDAYWDMVEDLSEQFGD